MIGRPASIQAPAGSLPPPIEQPPLRLAINSGPPMGIGVAVGNRGTVGIGVFGGEQTPESHSSPVRQSFASWQAPPVDFGSSQDPSSSKMLHNCEPVQEDESQHTGLPISGIPGLTPDVQLPDAQASGFVGSQSAPFSSNGVAVGVGAVQLPSTPGNWHDEGGAQLELRQHTFSGVLQKYPA